MFKFLNLQPEIFGVDVNDLSLRIIKLRKTKKGFSVVSFNEIDIQPGVIKEGTIQDPETLIKSIRLACSTVKGEKLNTNYAIISLPEEKSFSQVIEMPKMSEAELQSAVPFEAENYIPLTIDKVYLDFQVIEAGKSHTNHLDLLINVMPKHVVNSYVACFKEAGLIPCVLEVESQAIVRALLAASDKDKPTIFIDFGRTKTSFVIFAENSIRFTGTIPISSSQLTEAIAKGLGVSFEKAEEFKIGRGLVYKNEATASVLSFIEPLVQDLASQVKKYVDFYHGHISNEYLQASRKIEKIILCGGGANLKGLPEFLSEAVGLRVETRSPFMNVDIQKIKKSHAKFSERPLSFATALGLAMRGASEPF